MGSFNHSDPCIFNLRFEGSISDYQRQSMPTYGGVYLVYRGIWSEKDRLFFCREIMYIGQAENIRNRHENHEYRQLFWSQCRPGEIVFYSFAEVPERARSIVEAALIYHTKPRLNTQGKDCYPFPSTHVLSSGACALLDPDIFVQ